MKTIELNHLTLQYDPKHTQVSWGTEVVYLCKDKDGKSCILIFPNEPTAKVWFLGDKSVTPTLRII